MNIIHAIFSFNVGGAETMLVDIINHQCNEASISLIVVNEKINNDLLRTIDKRVNVFLIGRKESNKFQLFSTYRKINQIVNKINPDVIHCHDNKLFPFFINWRKKCCLTVHNVRLSKLFLIYFKTLFAISTAVQDDIKKRVGIHVPVVYNGIEIEQYKNRTKYIFNKDNEVFNVVLLSRLFPEQKGQHIAIQSISLLKQQNLNIKLYLIGGGDENELTKLKEFAVKFDVLEHIEFKGQVDREWIKYNLKNYHLLIQPSLYEGFGLTITEGFAAGLPVIASDLDGPKEICHSLNAGILAKANNPVDLAEKIRKVYEEYTSNNLLSTNYIVKDKKQLAAFDIRTTVSRYFDFYKMIKL